MLEQRPRKKVKAFYFSTFSGLLPACLSKGLCFHLHWVSQIAAGPAIGFNTCGLKGIQGWAKEEEVCATEVQQKPQSAPWKP